MFMVACSLPRFAVRCGCIQECRWEWDSSAALTPIYCSSKGSKRYAGTIRYSIGCSGCNTRVHYLVRVNLVNSSYDQGPERAAQ